jgi:amidohydrolase
MTCPSSVIIEYPRPMFATTVAPLPINQSRLRPAIQALQGSLVEWRRHLHQRPELGFREWLTADFIVDRLRAWGIDHQGGHGCPAHPGGEPGPLSFPA